MQKQVETLEDTAYIHFATLQLPPPGDKQVSPLKEIFSKDTKGKKAIFKMPGKQGSLQNYSL